MPQNIIKWGLPLVWDFADTSGDISTTKQDVKIQFLSNGLEFVLISCTVSEIEKIQAVSPVWFKWAVFFNTIIFFCDTQSNLLPRFIQYNLITYSNGYNAKNMAVLVLLNSHPTKSPEYFINCYLKLKVYWSHRDLLSNLMDYNGRKYYTANVLVFRVL